MARRIATEFPQFHDDLLELLDCLHPLVAAYALMTLRMMGSPVLANLPASLLSCKSKVTIALGCSLQTRDLSGLAREYQKEVKKKARSHDL